MRRTQGTGSITARPRRQTFLGLSRPEIDEDAIAEVIDSLRSGWVIAGPKVRQLEAALEERIPGAHVRCLSAGTAGLLLGLKLCGVGRDDEVLVPTLTFAACANVVEQLGARPVFVDSDPATGLLDMEDAERRITPRTKAMLGVHLGGRPLDLDRLNALAERNGLQVVEDAAHAIGATWRGRTVGSHGNPTAFSFHATKNMTTLEGGALAVPGLGLAERAERLSLHGLDRSAWQRHGSGSPADYELEEPGFKLTMTDVGAAVGIHQIRRLDDWIERRRHLAQRYDELLDGLPLEFQPPLEAHSRHAHHLYAVRISQEAPIRRDEVIERLRNDQIGASVHFKPLHRFRYYRDRYELDDTQFPAAAGYADRTLSLPLFPAMSDEDQEDVADSLARALL